MDLDPQTGGASKVTLDSKDQSIKDFAEAVEVVDGDTSYTKIERRKNTGKDSETVPYHLVVRDNTGRQKYSLPVTRGPDGTLTVSVPTNPKKPTKLEFREKTKPEAKPATPKVEKTPSKKQPAKAPKTAQTAPPADKVPEGDRPGKTKRDGITEEGTRPIAEDEDVDVEPVSEIPDTDTAWVNATKAAIQEKLGRKLTPKEEANVVALMATAKEGGSAEVVAETLDKSRDNAVAFAEKNKTFEGGRLNLKFLTGGKARDVTKREMNRSEAKKDNAEEITDTTLSGSKTTAPDEAATEAEARKEVYSTIESVLDAVRKADPSLVNEPAELLLGALLMRANMDNSGRSFAQLSKKKEDIASIRRHATILTGASPHTRQDTVYGKYVNNPAIASKCDRRFENRMIWPV